MPVVLGDLTEYPNSGYYTYNLASIIPSVSPRPSLLRRYAGRVLASTTNTLYRYPAPPKTEDYTRVLHIGCVGENSPNLIRNVEKHGYTGRCIARTANDPWGLVADNPLVDNLDVRAYKFPHHVNLACRDYGILHVHFAYQYLPALRKRWPNKIIVMHYHGSDLLNCTNHEYRMKCASFADVVAYARNDMAEMTSADPVPSAYIPLAPNLRMFGPGKVTGRGGKALLMVTKIDDVEKITAHLDAHCPWKYMIHDCAIDPVPYKEMPEFLRGYDRFINCRFIKGRAPVIMNFSVTHLEALACGLEVWDAKTDRTYKGLPTGHTPEAQGRAVSEMYGRLRRARGDDVKAVP